MTNKILLADDSVTIQKVIELTFMDQDYEVTAVSTGDEAVEQLEATDPDLVIADVHMPGASGYEVARRSKQRAPGVPVLLLVGTFEPFDEGEMAESGADSHLKKPFDSQELLQLVESLMASARKDAGAEAGEETPAAPPAPAAAAPPAAPAASSEDEAAHAVEMGDGNEPIWGNLELDSSQEPASEGAGDVLSLGDDAVGGDEDLSLDEDFSLGDEPSAKEAPQALGEELGEVLSGEGGTSSPPPTQVMPPDPPAQGETPAPATAQDQEPFELGAPAAAPAEATPTGVPAAASPEAPAPEPPATTTAESSPGEAPDAGAGDAVGGLSDHDVDRIARRVAELVGPEAVRHVAWEVVPDMAEVLIKDRIRELESQVE